MHNRASDYRPFSKLTNGGELLGCRNSKSDRNRQLGKAAETFDQSARVVTKNGAPCALTPKAYELLLALVRRQGGVATRADLLKEVWGYGAFVMTRTVDSHIAELRRKLEDDPANPRHVVTVWKVGYRFEF